MGLENVISYTKNPLDELSIISQKYNVDQNLLDFKLLAFSTRYKLNNQDFIKLSEKELNIFEKDDLFLREDLQIEQEYKIQFFLKNKKDELCENIILNSNKNLTKIIAQINTKNISYKDSLAMDMLQNIYTKMIKLNFLIGIRTFDFKKELLSLSNKIKNKQTNAINNIEVCKGVDPIYSQKESLIEVYKEKIKNLPQEAKVSGIVGVSENEIILKINKSKDGKEGRDLKLRLLKVVKQNGEKISISHSDNIKSQETNESVDFIALKKGYVSSIDNKYDIADIIDYKSIDFRQVGYIKAGLDNGVKINIKSSSDLQDAVNSGVQIECEELNINGNVAQNTILGAKILNISGNTHTKSKSYATKAYIKTHRGELIADEVQIDFLEGGYVEAKNVKINKSLGGIIKAENIYIKELSSNNLITFFSNIILENEKGNNNKFIGKIKIKHENPIEFSNELNQKKEKISQDITKCEKIIHSNEKDINTIKSKIEQLKSNNQEIPQNYINISKHFDEQLKELEKLKNEENKINEELKQFEDDILKAQELLLNAKIINKSGKWSELDEIKYEFILPHQEETISTKENENVKTFYIENIKEENIEKIKIIKSDKYEEKDIEWLSQSKD